LPAAATVERAATTVFKMAGASASRL
jgi:hypothetical protein